MDTRIATFALFLVAQPALTSADGSFTGTLERVGDQSISIRLPDRRVICGLLPDSATLSPPAIAAKYQYGDRVDITTKPIEPVWEAGTSRYQYLEVTELRLLSRPSREELAVIRQVPPFREGENLLADVDADTSPPRRAVSPVAGTGHEEWERARAVNLDYAQHMPNFVADETQKRYRSTAQSPRWTSFDSVETEVTFRGTKTTRRQIRRNGKPWPRPFEALPGFKWYGGFGSEIRPLFSPYCPSSIEFAGRSKKSGLEVLEYRFRTELDGCFPFFYYQYQRYNPPRVGRVFIEESTGNALAG